MIRLARKHLTFANAMSVTAMFIALGGGAYALTLPKNSVRSAHIKNGQVKGPDLAASSITSPKVKDRSLKATDFAAGELPKGDKGDKGDKGEKGDACPATDPACRGLQGEPGTAGAPATSLFGYIASTAQLVSGSGITNVAPAGTGTYNVTFNRSLENCAVLISVGKMQPSPIGDTSQNTSRGNANVSSGTPTVVNVATFDSTGAASNRGFSLAAFC